MTWIWLGVTLLAIVAELFTTELISIWFVGGGIVAVCLLAICVLLLKRKDEEEEQTARA